MNCLCSCKIFISVEYDNESFSYFCNNKYEELKNRDLKNESNVESVVKKFNKKEWDKDNKLIENKLKKCKINMK